ncbi:hypothetical protein V1514DRAFT_338575 [Lipomyces japonicus]|uniref:uncharacterized protein n=1 Tax=Lipomyces japonicus TaxID=56871 RepID=UPI0034CF8D32
MHDVLALGPSTSSNQSATKKKKENNNQKRRPINAASRQMHDSDTNQFVKRDLIMNFATFLWFLLNNFIFAPSIRSMSITTYLTYNLPPCFFNADDMPYLSNNDAYLRLPSLIKCLFVYQILKYIFTLHLFLTLRSHLSLCLSLYKKLCMLAQYTALYLLYTDAFLCLQIHPFG